MSALETEIQAAAHPDTVSPPAVSLLSVAVETLQGLEEESGALPPCDASSEGTMMLKNGVHHGCDGLAIFSLLQRPHSHLRHPMIFIFFRNSSKKWKQFKTPGSGFSPTPIVTNAERDAKAKRNADEKNPA